MMKEAVVMSTRIQSISKETILTSVLFFPVKPGSPQAHPRNLMTRPIREKIQTCFQQSTYSLKRKSDRATKEEIIP